MEESEGRKKDSLGKMIKKNPWILSTFVFGILAIILIITSAGITGNVSGNEAGERFVNFFNEKTDGNIELVSSSSLGNDLYDLVFLVEGQEVPGQITKDGKYFVQVLYEIDAEDTTSTDTSTQTPVNVPKSDKPVVELFVMAYCPFGTMAEKGLIPVMNLLGNKIDAKIRFVYYAMHPTYGEVEEQLNQYCIQEEQNDKYIDYLTCFLGEGDSASCLTETGIDVAKLKTCYNRVDKEYDVLANLEDESSWLNGRYPLFNVNSDLNAEYGIGGSPTLVINGVALENQGRDSASYLASICAAFNDAPAECSEVLSSTSPSSGFGWDGTGAASDAQCG